MGKLNLNHTPIDQIWQDSLTSTLEEGFFCGIVTELPRTCNITDLPPAVIIWCWLRLGCGLVVKLELPLEPEIVEGSISVVSS